MRTQELTVSSFTDAKGRKVYSVSEGTTPAMAATPNRADAVKCLATLTARLAARGITPEVRYWDGDLGDYTNAYPTLSNSRS
jgi:hypothetical protein